MTMIFHDLSLGKNVEGGGRRVSVGQVGIMNHLMGAGGPHWCEDPVVDRENQVGDAGVWVGPLGLW